MKKTKNIIAMSALIALLSGCNDDKETLYVYTWSDYFSPEMIVKFEERNNCKVVIDSFDSNEAMYAKIKVGGISYDILTPSTYQIATLIKEGLISKIDGNMIPNVVSNFNHNLDNQILDTKFTWSVPYACTYAGLMCVSNKVGKFSSWRILGDPKFKGKISLLDDIRETIGIGLMYNGCSINSTNDAEIINAARQISEWKENIRKFDAESYKLEVANGSSLIGHGYSSDAAQIILQDERRDIVFVLPDEGFSVAWDEFVIAHNSTKKELAHRFIDFFFENDVSLENTEYICTLTASKYAMDNVSEDMRNFLMPKNVEKGQLIKGFDDEKILEYYNAAWDIIKSTKK